MTVIHQFNRGEKSWKIYAKELTTKSGDSLDISSSSDIIFTGGQIRSKGDLIVEGEFLPKDNSEDLDIGSADKPFRDLYISENSIHMGSNVILTVDPSNDHTFKIKKFRNNWNTISSDNITNRLSEISRGGSNTNATRKEFLRNLLIHNISIRDIEDDIFEDDNIEVAQVIIKQPSTNYKLTLVPTENMTKNITFKLPITTGDDGQVLQTNGSGVLTWTNQSEGGGFTTQLSNGIKSNHSNIDANNDSIVFGDHSKGGATEITIGQNGLLNNNKTDNQYNIGIGYEVRRYPSSDGTTTTRSINIGYRSGDYSKGQYNTCVGDGTGGGQSQINGADNTYHLAGYCTAIGANSISVPKSGGTIGATAVGYYSGQARAGNYSVGIGYMGGAHDLGAYSVAIGYESNYSSNTNYNVSIGYTAGRSDQQANSIAIGSEAGYTTQCEDGIAIGYRAGKTNQGNSGSRSIAIGHYSGSTNQGHRSVAIGAHSGHNSQGNYSVGVGQDTGQANQGQSSVAVGPYSGRYDQGDGCIAIGAYAGSEDQGKYSIAIGHYAGYQNQHTGTIVLNAQDAALNTTVAQAFYVKPIRDATNSNKLLYNSSTGEITYQADSGGSSDAVTLTDDQTIAGTKTFSSTIAGNINGNAATATALASGITIGGVSFDGTANINLPGVNTGGNQNTSGSAATLTTARSIGGVSFDGSADISLPGVNTGGNQNTSGNAATATALASTITIGGVSFNGTSNIDLPGVNTGGNQNTSGTAATATKITSIANSDIVQLTALQTLSNKTLSSPLIISENFSLDDERCTVGSLVLQGNGIVHNNLIDDVDESYSIKISQNGRVRINSFEDNDIQFLNNNNNKASLMTLKANQQIEMAGPISAASIGNQLGMGYTGYDYNWALRLGNSSYQGNPSLHTTGYIYATLGYQQPSDDNLKSYTEDINNALDLLNQLKPKKYKKHNYLYTSNETPDLSNVNHHTEIGLIAQDIETIDYLKHTVSEVPFYTEDGSSVILEDGITQMTNKRLNYTEFIPLCIQGIKELKIIHEQQEQTQQNEINELKTKVSNLESENAIMKTALNELLSQAGKQTI
jgi:hypothetical protein